MNNLDIYQRQAVLSTHRNTVVTACPGAGKTTVICGRICWMIEGLLPTSPRSWRDHGTIIVITYTNNAASEFRKRLPAAIVARLAFCGTIHGFAKWFIEKFCRSPDGEETVVSVMDDEETMEQIEALSKHLGLKLTKTAMKEIARRTDDPPVGVCHDPADNLYRAHMKRQWDTARFSFSGLIATARREMNRAGAETFDLVVDEYQDASSATHELLEALPCVSRFYVMDVNQAIFGFIGGKPAFGMELMERAKSDPENWTHVQLENTYRCAAEIAEAANEVVARTPIRTVMASRSAEQGIVTWEGFATSEQEQAWVAGCIVQPFYDVNEMAVICRTNAQCAAMRSKLRNMGVPVKEKLGRETLPGLREALTILDYLANPESEHAVEAVNRLVLTPFELMDTKRQALIACASMVGPRIPEGKPLVYQFGFLCGQIEDGPERVPVSTMVAIERTMWANPGINAGDLALLIRSPDFELEPEQETDGVTVTTAHGAKGLEWDAVWIIGCNTCYWKGSPDEERRLFYVALTRARSYVCASWADLCSRSVKGRILDPVASEPIPAVREHLERTLPRTRRAQNMPPELQTGAMNDIERNTPL